MDIGRLETAHTLQDADCYGVARIGEARCCAPAASSNRSCCWKASSAPKDLPVLVANNIETAVHCIEQLEALEQADWRRCRCG